MQQSFYGKIHSTGYDINEGRHELLTYYMSKWQQAGSPSPLLEPMCGTGFFLLALLEAGADGDGLDSSPYMLAVCQQKCAAKGLYPTLYQQFLEVMALPRQYAFILIPDSGFAHLYDKAVAQTCLHKLNEHLLPGGWLMLDLKSPPREGSFGKPGQIEVGVEDRPDGSIIFSTTLWSEREDGRVLRCLTKYEHFVQSKLVETELLDYNHRFYARDEFATMLVAAGFTDIHTTKGWDDREPSEHDTIVYTCRKPGSVA